MNNLTVAEALYLQRHRRRISQIKLATLSGVNRNTIRAVEAGHIEKMHLSTIVSIAEALGLALTVTLKPAETPLGEQIEGE